MRGFLRFYIYLPFASLRELQEFVLFAKVKMFHNVSIFANTHAARAVPTN